MLPRPVAPRSLTPRHPPPLPPVLAQGTSHASCFRRRRLRRRRCRCCCDASGSSPLTPTAAVPNAAVVCRREFNPDLSPTRGGGPFFGLLRGHSGPEVFVARGRRLALSLRIASG